MKILVPTDFSKNAQRAIDYAIEMAGKSDAEIILMHAHQVIDTASSTRKLLFEEFNINIAKKLHDELHFQKARISKINPRIRVKSEFCNNEPGKAIIEAGADVDYIVMGTQGATGLKRLFIGSVTAWVIGNARTPVLAIPRSYKWRSPKNILLATNRFEQSNDVLAKVLNLSEIFDTELHIAIFSDIDTDSETEMLHQNTKLDQYKNELEKETNGLRITTVHLTGSTLEEALRDYITRQHIDILAMVTRKRNLLEQVFNPSITRRMAYVTNVPLLAIPVND